MSKALAAGQGGTVSAPQMQEQFRRSITAAAPAHLAEGTALLRRCRTMIEDARGERFGLLYAAARVLTADAAVGKEFGKVVAAARRRRTIVERIQTLDPQIGELNSLFLNPKSKGDD